MSRRRNQFNSSAFSNNYSYNFYEDRLTELSISMFEWVNLPDSVDPIFLERTLFRNGSAVFFEDDGGLGYMALPVSLNGQFDPYMIPTKYRAYAVNGYQRDLTQQNSVLIYNNMIRTNSLQTVKMYANKLWDIDRSIMVNARSQKTPVLLQCTEQQRLTLINLYKEVDGNQPVITADKNLDINNTLKAINTGAPFVADKLYQLKTQIWNESLTYLGISNLNIQKKERLVSDEVIRNAGGVIASRHSRLESRRQAADKINKMFGLNIEVNYREDFREADDEIMFSGQTGNEQFDSGSEKINGTPMAIDIRTN